MQRLEKALNELSTKLDFANQLNYCLLMSNIISHSNIDENDKQLLLLLLQNRDKNYIRINHNNLVYENIKAYLMLIRPLEIPADKLERVGGKEDGGYVLFKPAANTGGGGGRALQSPISWRVGQIALGFRDGTKRLQGRAV